MVEIDIARYDYLDNASLEQFVTEFLYRNEVFQRDYQQMMQADSEEARFEFTEKYGVLPELRRGEVRVGVMWRPPIFIPVMVAVRIHPKSYRRKTQKPILLETEVKESFGQPGYLLISETSGINKSRSDVDWLLRQLWGNPNSEGEYATGDCMVIKFSINQSESRIMDQIKKILGTYIESDGKYRKRQRNYKTRQHQFRRKEWKHYLIVYDLIKEHPHLGCEEIAKSLTNTYPDDVNKSFDANDSDDYNGEAIKLINYRWKEFI